MSEPEVNRKSVCVSHNGTPLIILEIPEQVHLLMDDILKHYAEKFGFDRQNLTGEWVQVMRKWLPFDRN